MRPWARGLLIAVAIVLAVLVLFVWVFPWFESTYVTNPVLDG